MLSVLRALRTTPPLRVPLASGLRPISSRLLARLGAASRLGGLSGLGGRWARRRPARQMAVRMPAPQEAVSLQMAVPFESGPPSRLSLLAAAGFLALSTASLWHQESVVELTRAALDGLVDHQAVAFDVDAADRPAMDPGLAWIVDPRGRFSPVSATQQRRSAVQPFEYEVKPGESLQDIATRFGTDVSTLLWNNGLDSADQLEAGARLTILPVRGVLHLVKDGETAASIAERYGSRADDVIAANGLDRPDRLPAGRVIVVAGGSVPMPLAITGHGFEVAIGAAQAAVAALPVPDLGFTMTPPAVPAPAPREETLPDPPGASSWQRDFILSVARGARESQRATGVPASVTLAQAILESDWGRSKLTRDANNLFGIKAFSVPGTAGTYDIATREVYGSGSTMVMASFKAYTTLEDSIVDHGNWFHDNSRYHGALAVKDDPRAFARAISAAGYATDPGYAPALITLMDRYNLYAYDVQPGE
ncbi:MAG: glucosaminidase domain-containing protein [Chloroflexota bacterium]